MGLEWLSEIFAASSEVGSCTVESQGDTGLLSLSQEEEEFL